MNPTYLRSTNPATEEILESFEFEEKDIIIDKLNNAMVAFQEWRRVPINHRAEMLRKVGDQLTTEQESCARLITIEMGKPINESRAEIEKCAKVCHYYADNGKHFLKDEQLKTEASSCFISHEPIGVLLAIMPWNFPFWQFFRFAAPALMAGNVILMKHAPNVPQCARKIIQLFLKADWEFGVNQNIYASEEMVDGLIADHRVAAVTLTGSTKAGSIVGRQCGHYIKKCVLELGGSDPFIVCDDSNLNAATDVAVKSRLLNNGQSCIAAKRFLVSETVMDTFLDLVKEKVLNLKMGNPLDEDTDLGPMARYDLKEELLKQVVDSIGGGAELLDLGEQHLRAKGWYYNPQILLNVKPGMPAFDQEIFGPVFAITSFKDEEEALRLANLSDYGLGASIWTTDIEKGQRYARKIQSGCVFVNELVRSDQRIPFGGMKKSGFGRELSHLGIKEFVNEKTIWVG